MEYKLNWTYSLIDDLISDGGIFCDGDWVESKDQDPQGEVRLIQLADIGDGVFKDKSHKFLTLKRSKDLNCTYLEKNDILIARLPDPLGRACLVPFDRNKRYVTAVDVCIVRPNTNYVHNTYLLYTINSPIFRVEVDKYKSGSTRKRISKKNLSKIEIPIPPLPEQRAIVAKIEQLFSDLDNGIASLKKAQEQLKRYRQSVLKAACEGRLVPTEARLARAEGRDYEPADVLLARILKERREKWNGKGKYKEPAAPDTNRLPELPGGWCLANVGQMTDSMKNGIYKPKEFYAEDGFACLRMYNIDQGKIVWKDIKRMNLTKEEIDEYLLVPGDLLVNRVNSRELVGKAAVISSGIEKCVFESKNIRVRVLNEVVNPYYLCYHFTLAGTEYFNRNAQQVVGMASISQPQIARFPVLPSPRRAALHRYRGRAPPLTLRQTGSNNSRIPAKSRSPAPEHPEKSI